MSAPMLTRPNGKPYRPRKEPSVDLYEDHHDGLTGFVVLRTHDREKAAEMVAGVWASYYDGPLPEGRRSWWRLVPWGYQTDSTWIEDPARGIPVVVFEPEPWT